MGENSIMMLMSDLLRMSFHNLLLHKVRSILTSLGVIFGVGSVIAMLAISEGAKRSALAQIESMGIDKILLFSKQPSRIGVSEGSTNASVVESYGLTTRDLTHIGKMDNVSSITGLFNSRKKVLKGLQRTDLQLVGCDFGFLENSPAKIESGRWFSKTDFTKENMVCVIGKNVKRTLFPIGSTNIVGGTVRVEDYVFRVVGILDNPYNSQYQGIGGQNDMILIPMPTARACFKSYTFTKEARMFQITKIDYDVLLVQVNDTTYIDNTAKRIAGYLNNVHGQTKDWDIVVPLELLKQQEQTQNIFTIVMGSIAGISLIVGGIGIMNIMLASVFERRKEIGTRRALGAQKADILMQFLIETVFLTTMGGVLGIALGVGIAKIITYYSAMPTVYAWWSVVLSLVISCVVGIIFGTYPAWQAAQQNPITVLRSE